jgi:heme exporter protein CcmD
MGAASHAGFILAAYLAAAVIIGFIAVWIALDYRALRRTLDEYESRGLTRRSGQPPVPPG